MNTNITVIGILLIVVGIAIFVFNGFSYTQSESIAEIGNLQITAETQKNVYLPPVLGGLSFVLGTVLLVIGRRNKK